MRNGTVALILGALLMACGGDEAAPPPAAPPAPPMAATPMTPAPTMTAAAPAAPKPSMAEMQATTAKAVAESMNAHDAKKFAATFSEDGVWNFAGAGEYKGRAEIEKQIQSFFDGFKDVKFSFTRAWMKGDMAAMEWSWAGTNTGEYMGMKPTEKQAGGMGLSLVWFNPDGSVKRNNHYTDMATTMTQLGAVKGKARAVPATAANMDAWSAKGTPEEDKNVDGWKSMMSGLENKKEADFIGVLSVDI